MSYDLGDRFAEAHISVRPIGGPDPHLVAPMQQSAFRTALRSPEQGSGVPDFRLDRLRHRNCQLFARFPAYFLDTGACKLLCTVLL